MAWGEGVIQMCDVVVDGPLELSKFEIFIKIQDIQYSQFQNGVFGAKIPRRVRRRLAQRLHPLQMAEST